MTPESPITPIPPAPPAKGGPWMARIAVGLALSLAVGVGAGYFAAVKFAAPVAKAPVVKPSDLQIENAELRSKLEAVEADRNNVLTQTKMLLAEKMKWAGDQDAIRTLRENNQRFSEQKNKLHQDNLNLSKKFTALKVLYERLTDASAELDMKIKVLEHENKALKEAFGKRAQESPEYKRMSKLADGFKYENKKLKDSIRSLDRQLKDSRSRINKIQDRDKRFAKRTNSTDKTLKSLKVEKNTLLETNKRLNKQLADLPGRFRKMAEENRRLLREASQMHYNLGVFYLQNKSYDMAVKEFKRALDLNPNDPKIHYNLGYLYSEQYEKHEEALAHFRRFLELSPETKESDQVRVYVLTRESYGDKPKPGVAAGKVK